MERAGGDGCQVEGGSGLHLRRRGEGAWLGGRRGGPEAVPRWGRRGPRDGEGVG